MTLLDMYGPEHRGLTEYSEGGIREVCGLGKSPCLANSW